MNGFWVLVAMPIVGLVYVAYLIATDKRAGMPASVMSSQSIQLQIVAPSAPYSSHKRKIARISRRECECLLRHCEDLILINLTQHRSIRSTGLTTTCELFVHPNEMRKIIRWLPPESSAVLYGEVDMCNSVLTAVRDTPGKAPLYVLEETPIRSDLARGAAWGK